MPKKSERQELLDDIEQELILRELLDSSSEDERSSEEESEHVDRDDDDDIWQLYVQVQCNRYLEPREHVPRAPQRLEWLLFQLDERRFKQEVRITKDAFQELLVK